ncbi:MAG TPA: DapH/DapD/GlmU-related protein [Candidatus Dojkabacteria bacterium]|nr:DapH/DapD/GlmU-related protein [Methanofastidiosum sp.]HRZ84715.1 DapH/DapD/GlmU-related protein [Candidatus Dojkabacteria bacterium]
MEFKEGFNKSDYSLLEDNIKIHPNAEIEKGAKIGANTTVHKAVIGVVDIGENCIIGNFTLVEDSVSIGDGSKIWHFSHVRNGVNIGKNCILGNYVYIDSGVSIGDETKIQNYVPVFHGVNLEEGVFLGPNSLTTNDMIPRARTDDGQLQSDADWQVSAIFIGKDASIGAGAVLRPGIKIGEKALIGAGAVVTKDVPPGAVVVGNPGRILRYVDGYEPK